MAGNGWNDLGQDLNRIIEDAVHMRNFGSLNRNINDALRRAFQMNGDEFRGGDGWDFNLSGSGKGTRDTQPGEAAYASYKPAHAYFAGGGKRRAGAIARLAGGIALAGLAFGFCIASIVFMAAADAGAASLIISLLGMTAGVVLIVSGAGGLQFARRFDHYVKCLQGNDFIDISRLAQYSNRKESAVLKDVRKMLAKGWFTEGHLDQSEKCLMVTHKAYEQYLSTVRNVRTQEAEKLKKQQEAAAGRSGLSPEAKAVIDKGQEYIKEIRRCNDEIPGQEISDKIYHMEQLVKRIFEQAEAHPENISDLRKLMEYYLPMTIKLLNAYEELDRQPVQGENIRNSKKEIEGTLDTLNAAFAKLLDDLFKDTAWDVSADISVLETMLAQEGLTGNGFAGRK
ncbi:MAG: 5-bromo-4-chloroindolyl phosphate hydrolysis family protein [Bacillota bacterium]|nr:5-bromo-4-chloroindolyl phosphate hydrolysis family protein [Bacillota bacterium]